MATLQQLEEGIRRADKAGDAEAVRALGAEYRKLQGQSSQQPEQTTTTASQTAPNPIERFGQALGSTFTGATQGATLGAYDELASLLGTPIKAAENLMSGRDRINGIGDVGNFLGRSFNSALKGQQNVIQQAQEQAPVAYGAGDVMGALGMGALMGGGGLLTSAARPTVTGMAARGALEGGLTGGTAGFNVGEQGDTSLPARLQAAGEGALAGGAIGGITGGIFGGLAGRAQAKAVPSTQDLADEAGALYQAARRSGVQAPPQMSQGIADTIESIARSENVRLPSGKVNQTYPKISGVLNVFEEYAGKPLDVGQMQAIRRNLQDAAKSLDPGERRIATIMLGEFDDFATGVAPELAEASNLYWRSKLGETIDEAIELAENRSGQYSQSGMENALRTQFRQLNAKIIKGQLRGIPPELAQQIRLVADGSPVQNFARNIGKLAVRGPVSALPAILAGGAGAAGGPIGAAIGAGAVALPGEIGRTIAERAARQNANLASAIARSGGNLPAWQFTPALPALTQGGASLAARALPKF